MRGHGPPGSHCDKVHVMMIVSVASIAECGNDMTSLHKESQTAGPSPAHDYAQVKCMWMGNHGSVV